MGLHPEGWSPGAQNFFNSKLFISFLTCAKIKGFLMLPLPKFLTRDRGKV
jgi:hypothetical protein